MGKFEDYINRVIESSAAGPYKAGWQIHTLKEDYKRKYGRYPSKDEFLEYGNSIMGENSISQPSEEASKILKSLELSKEKLSDDSVRNVSFNKTYKIWK